MIPEVVKRLEVSTRKKISKLGGKEKEKKKKKG